MENFVLNWELCILCQEVTSEAVKQPAKSNDSENIRITYNEAARLLKAFADLNEIPNTLVL